MLRAASNVLSLGLEAKRRWRERVVTKPISKGGAEDGTIRSVYSTPMKNKSPNAKKQGIQWCLATWTASCTVHVMNEALLQLPLPWTTSFMATLGLVPFLAALLWRRELRAETVPFIMRAGQGRGAGDILGKKEKRDFGRGEGCG